MILVFNNFKRVPTPLKICFQWCICALLIACEDKIQIKIPDSNLPKLVVESINIISDINDRVSIGAQLSYSTNYESSSTKKTIDSALVYLETDDNEKTAYESLGLGRYSIRDQNFRVKYGKSYRMRIIIGPNEYLTTFQKLNFSVDIDTVTNVSGKDVYPPQNTNLGKEYLAASFTDPKDTVNFYAWHLSIPNFNFLDMTIMSDIEIGDGKKIPLEYLWFDIPVDSKVNLVVGQLSINENYFLYLEELKNVIAPASLFETPKSNPIANIYNVNDSSEEILGFFEMASQTSKKFTYTKP